MDGGQVRLMEEPTRRRPAVVGLECFESLEREDGYTSVVFHCNLPIPTGNNTSILELAFNCREPSCGALEDKEEAATLSDEDYQVDANFFDAGYSLAGATGFKVWTGTRLMIECLAWPNANDCTRLKAIQHLISDGARVLELGSGVGVLGSYLSAIGSQVLMTDLPTLVENSIDMNIVRNKDVSSQTALDNNECPSWLLDEGVKIGKGWASSAALDWTQPLEDQLMPKQTSSLDFIVASDVVFLQSMLNSLLDTFDLLFKCSKSNPPLILSFQRRDAKDGEESIVFTTVKGVLQAVRNRGWGYENLAWRTVKVKKQSDNGDVKDEESEVFLFEIKP